MEFTKQITTAKLYDRKKRWNSWKKTRDTSSNCTNTISKQLPWTKRSFSNKFRPRSRNLGPTGRNVSVREKQQEMRVSRNTVNVDNSFLRELFLWKQTEIKKALSKGTMVIENHTVFSNFLVVYLLVNLITTCNIYIMFYYQHRLINITLLLVYKRFRYCNTTS